MSKTYCTFHSLLHVFHEFVSMISETYKLAKQRLNDVLALSDGNSGIDTEVENGHVLGKRLTNRPFSYSPELRHHKKSPKGKKVGDRQGNSPNFEQVPVPPAIFSVRSLVNQHKKADIPVG